MSDTPRTNAEWRSITVSSPWDAAAEQMAQHARQLERELADLNDQITILRSDEKRLEGFAKTYRLRADEAEDQLAALTCEEGELWELRQANARMRNNLASLSKLHAVEMSKAQESFERELAAERALADRLALSLDIALGDWSELYATHETPAYDEAQVTLAAWKEARRE